MTVRVKPQITQTMPSTFEAVMDESGNSETGGTSKMAYSKYADPFTDSTNWCICLELNKSAGCFNAMPANNMLKFGICGGTNRLGVACCSNISDSPTSCGEIPNT